MIYMIGIKAPLELLIMTGIYKGIQNFFPKKKSIQLIILPKSNENPLSLFERSIGNSTIVSLEEAIIALKVL